MTLPAWFRSRDWRTGGYHAIGALALQNGVAWALWANGVLGAGWWAAALVSAMFALREVWQWRTKTPPVWWQDRFWWDVGTAGVPALIAASAWSFFT